VKYKIIIKKETYGMIVLKEKIFTFDEVMAGANTSRCIFDKIFR